MTAITLNLLVEEQRAQEARARDPLKTCIAIGVSLVMVTAVIGSLCGVAAGNKKTEENALKHEYDNLLKQRDAGAATGFSALKAHAETMIEINRKRVLLAPQMALIKDMVPNEIELTRLELRINTELEQGSTDNSRRNRNVERLTLKMEGRATSLRPELAVDDFIKGMSENGALKDVIDKVQLRSIASVPFRDHEKSTKGSAVSFVIEAAYKQP
jgi:hypothetical protein